MEKLRMYEPQPPKKGPGEQIEIERNQEYLRAFEEPADNLLKQLDKNIEAGMYSHVLGLDASGRIPSLIIGEYISVLSKRLGLPVPARIFTVPYHEDSSTPQLAQMYAQAEIIKKGNKRVLVVDDTFFSGNSLKQAADGLIHHDIPFDMGVLLGINTDEAGAERVRDSLGAKNFYIGDFDWFSDGFEGAAVPITKNKSLSGVVNTVVDPTEISRSQRRIENSKVFVAGRQEIARMVDDLIAKHDERKMQEAKK